MSESKKSWVSALGVVLATAVVYVGSVRRDQVDLGATRFAPTQSLTGLRADRTNDLDIPIAEYFVLLSRKLKDEYVEPILDDQKLASGTIRGLIGSLGDPRSLYMDAAEFKAYLNQRKGLYEGIGASLSLELDKPLPTNVIVTDKEEGKVQSSDVIPQLVVSAVVPGGPADRAGVKPGDHPEFIDGLWIPNSQELDRFREVSKKVALKQAPESQLIQMRNELRPKLEKSVGALKAKDKLILGTSGTVKVVWRRGTETRETVLTKEISKLPGSKLDGKTLIYRFDAAGKPLLEKVASEGGAWTLDLRANPEADPAFLPGALEALAPKGTSVPVLGKLGKKVHAFTVRNGPAKPLNLTVLADGSTHGAASQLAGILKTKGARITGNLKVDPHYIETKALGDGSGYTLVTGELKLGGTK